MTTPIQANPERTSPETTEIGEFDRQTEGFITIIPLPDHVKAYIGQLQETIAAEIPDSELWLPKGEQQHITFAHIVSPDAEYNTPQSELFESIRAEAESAVEIASQKIKGKTVIFNEIAAFPGAIILKGVDDGTLDEARVAFAQSLHTPEGTRTPPKIIHTTIARFRNEVPMDLVRRVVGAIQPDVEFQIQNLQLIQEHEMYTQSHTILKES
jgi:hypothetical protein